MHQNLNSKIMNQKSINNYFSFLKVETGSGLPGRPGRVVPERAQIDLPTMSLSKQDPARAPTPPPLSGEMNAGEDRTTSNFAITTSLVVSILFKVEAAL